MSSKGKKKTGNLHNDFSAFQSLKKTDRIKLLTSMIESLDIESRKSFFATMLPHILSDKDLTNAAFRQNTGKQDTRKNKSTDLSAKEIKMIGEIAGHMKELQLLVDFEDLMNNP